MASASDVVTSYILTIIHLSLFIQTAHTANKLDGRVINTKNGKLRGVITDFPARSLRPIVMYLGVQYASLRGSRLRFMPPISPPERPFGIQVAMKRSPVCPQQMFNETLTFGKLPRVRAEFLSRVSVQAIQQTEDCLSLNVYVPQREWNETTPFPVMVYIHGSSYTTGSGNAFDGSVLASFGRVIVVTVNFRLGVLGYLTVSGDKVPGNYALKDIIAALHWVKENIGAFDGDPSTVTLFGNGYGAALVNILMVSPVNGRNRLIKRAILQSGSALSPFAIAEDTASCALQLAQHTNCTSPTNSAERLIPCLTSKPVKSLVNKTFKSKKYFSCLGPYPHPKTPILPTGLTQMYENAHRYDIKPDVMFGFVKNEAYDYFTQNEIKSGLTSKRKTQIFRTFVHNMFKYQRQTIYEILAQYYTDYGTDITTRSRRDMIMNMLSDGIYVAPALKASRYKLNSGDTYMYVFNYTPRSETAQKPLGAIHGDELAFVFGAPLVNGSDLFPGRYTKTDRVMSEAIMTYWTNFAKSGNPNSPGAYLPAMRTRRRLPRFPTTANNTYLLFASKVRTAHNYRARQLSLWLNLIPKMHKNDKHNPAQHLLADSNDRSSFDAPDQLQYIKDVFPPPTRKPPHVETTKETNAPKPKPKVHHEFTTESTVNNTIKLRPIIKSANIQVSITIAVGCSLLFLNILVFAAIYYQRENIRRMKQPDSQPNGHVTVSSNEKGEMNHEHERIGLLGNGDSHFDSNKDSYVVKPSMTSSDVVYKSAPVTSHYSSPTSQYVPLRTTAPNSCTNSHLQYDGDKIRVEPDRTPSPNDRTLPKTSPNDRTINRTSPGDRTLNNRTSSPNDRTLNGRHNSNRVITNSVTMV